MLLNLFLIYIVSVLWVLGMLKMSNNNETFKELSCIHEHNNYKLLVGICLVPLVNSFMCIVVTVTFLLNAFLNYCKVVKGIDKIKRIIEKIVE